MQEEEDSSAAAEAIREEEAEALAEAIETESQEEEEDLWLADAEEDLVQTEEPREAWEVLKSQRWSNPICADFASKMACLGWSSSLSTQT